MDANRGINIVQLQMVINSRFVEDGKYHTSPAKAITAEAPSPTATALSNPNKSAAIHTIKTEDLLEGERLQHILSGND